MAAIYDVQNGVTVWDEEDVNQYGATLNNVLGITDTAQDALGRLVLPRAASAPGSPSNGQVYYDTDDHTPYIRRNGVWVPYLPIRQWQEVAFSNDSGIDLTANTSFADITGATLSITTTGGRLMIGIFPPDTGTIHGLSYVGLFGSPSDYTIDWRIRALIGATTLLAVGEQENPSQSGTYGGLVREFQIDGWHWVYQPAAGTYTVKLQSKIVVAGGFSTDAWTLYGGKMVVCELAG